MPLNRNNNTNKQFILGNDEVINKKIVLTILEHLKNDSEIKSLSPLQINFNITFEFYNANNTYDNFEYIIHDLNKEKGDKIENFSIGCHQSVQNNIRKNISISYNQSNNMFNISLHNFNENYNEEFLKAVKQIVVGKKIIDISDDLRKKFIKKSGEIKKYNLLWLIISIIFGLITIMIIFDLGEILKIQLELTNITKKINLLNLLEIPKENIQIFTDDVKNILINTSNIWYKIIQKISAITIISYFIYFFIKQYNDNKKIAKNYEFKSVFIDILLYFNKYIISDTQEDRDKKNLLMEKVIEKLLEEPLIEEHGNENLIKNITSNVLDKIEKSDKFLKISEKIK